MGRRAALENRATTVALQSTCRDRHGSLVTHGNRELSSGCNNSQRTYFMKKLDICEHAEMSAAREYVNKYARRLPSHQRVRKLRKLTVWSVRVSNGNLSLSLPCQICLYRLKSMGFGKIAFSNNNGLIEFHQINSLCSDHLSVVQKKYISIIRW